jgi:hypothetical protein
VVVLAAGLTGLLLRVSAWPAPTAAPARTASSGRAAGVGQAVSADPADPPALTALREWDRRRAVAYARGSSRMLRDLYVPHARAGRADVAVLEGYRARGLRVAGMRMQLLAVTVLAGTDDTLRLRVTDRLRGAIAVGQRHRFVLPTDAASTRTVTLRRGPAGRWRVAAVR